MSRVRRLALAAVGCIIFAVPMPMPDATAASFRRGATLVEFFNFARSTGDGPAKAYANPAYPNVDSALSQFKFDELRRIGFDHMRVPIDLGPLMRGGEGQRQVIIQQLHTVIAALHRHDLGVLVTFYPPSLHHEIPEAYLDGLAGPKFTLYVEMVERIARELASIRSGLVALEPMNEPQSECRAAAKPDWTSYQQFMVERIRRLAPDLALFLTGGCWSNIEGIVLLDSHLLRDRRNFVSVHFYYPFLFTHQTATWTIPYMAGVIGVPYPASEGAMDLALSLTRARFASTELPPQVDRAAELAKAEKEIRWYFNDANSRSPIEQWMNKLAKWQEQERVQPQQIVFTEFGAMKQLINGVEINQSSRMRWLRDASSAMERRGWGWTVYVLRDGPFGLYNTASDGRPDRRLLDALRLIPLAN